MATLKINLIKENGVNELELDIADKINGLLFDNLDDMYKNIKETLKSQPYIEIEKNKVIHRYKLIPITNIRSIIFTV